MLLYLTGAEISLEESSYMSPQNNINKSTGGYISSTNVPNNSLNGLFDCISMNTLKEKRKETIAIVLTNKFDFDISNLTIKISDNIGDSTTFKISSVEILNDMMERIVNRYEQPFYANFHDVSFIRAGVNIKIINPASTDEEFIIEPFDIIVKSIKEKSLNGTYEAIFDSFLDSEYNITRISEEEFRIESKNNEEENLECSFTTSGDLSLEFLSNYKNNKNNKLTLKEELKIGESIGLWITREIKNIPYITNEKLIEMYDLNIVESQLENHSLILEYDKIIPPATSYFWKEFNTLPEFEDLDLSLFNRVDQQSINDISIELEIIDKYLIIAIPVSITIKTEWKITQFNRGYISPTSLILPPQIFENEDGQYNLYVTSYKTTISPKIELKK